MTFTSLCLVVSFLAGLAELLSTLWRVGAYLRRARAERALPPAASQLHGEREQ